MTTQPPELRVSILVTQKDRATGEQLYAAGASAKNVEAFLAIQTCARCKSTFCELHNTGQYRCRQHAARFNGVGDGRKYPRGRWECCGADKYSLGCVPCDHRSVSDDWTFTNATRIPMFLLRFFPQPSRTAKIFFDGRDTAVIPRMDQAVARLAMTADPDDF